jgi:hypothetical protein
MSVQLEGQLALVPLRELIEMIAYSSVKGVLQIRSADTTAQLFFRDGLPCHANAGGLNGIDAVGWMFELEDGAFHFFAGSQPEEETLWYEAPDLIKRGEELAKQWLPLREHIPSSTWVPALVSQSSPQIQIEQDLWQVLAAVDGRRSAIAIGETLRLDAFDVCAALAKLRQQNLITIAPAPQSQPPGAADAAADPNQKRGFFERLIERTLEEDARNPGSRYAPPEQRYVESD